MFQAGIGNRQGSRQMQFQFEDLTAGLEDYRNNQLALNELTRRYWRDREFRERIDGGEVPAQVQRFAKYYAKSDTLNIRIVVDTPDTMHVVMTPDPNVGLMDEELGSVAGGGKCAGSAGSASSASSVACLCMPSSVSSASSASTAGSGS